MYGYLSVHLQFNSEEQHKALTSKILIGMCKWLSPGISSENEAFHLLIPN